jgi:predicted AAA+ superfamily ATPase
MSFFEFAEAMGEQLLVKQLKDQRWEIMNTYSSRLETLLRQYFYVGGMPEVVSAFVLNKDFVQVRTIQQAILDSYDHDFSKHAPVREVPRIRMIWRSVSGQLSKENKKFIYGFLKQGARAKDFELSLSWLQDAGLIYKVHRAKAGRLPLSAYEDFAVFKVFLLDVGLLGALSGVEAQMLLEENELFKEFKGALTEQYVMQQLRSNRQNMIYYWSQDNSQGEIDFLVQQGVRIYPIEVKAEENLQSKSLRWFVDHHTGMRGVRFSMSGYREQDWMTNYPLYSVEAIM